VHKNRKYNSNVRQPNLLRSIIEEEEFVLFDPDISDNTFMTKIKLIQIYNRVVNMVQ